MDLGSELESRKVEEIEKHPLFHAFIGNIMIKQYIISQCIDKLFQKLYNRYNQMVWESIVLCE